MLDFFSIRCDFSEKLIRRRQLSAVEKSSLLLVKEGHDILS